MKTSVQPFINKSILVLGLDTPAKVAARALHERSVGSAVISDLHGHVVGLVTDRDLSSLILGFGMPDDTPLAEVMATEIVKVNPSASIAEVIQVMEENAIRRVPVVEKTERGHERCVGMITLDDLIAAEAITTKQLGEIIRAQIVRGPRKHTVSYKNDDRNEQTMNRFFNIMAKKMDTKKEVAEKVTFYLLKTIVQIVPYTMASKFISQLPSLLQEDLQNQPAGPNVNINEESIKDDLNTKFQLDEETAEFVMRSFWVGLQESLDAGILNRVLDQLPTEVRDLFISEDDYRSYVVETSYVVEAQS